MITLNFIHFVTKKGFEEALKGRGIKYDSIVFIQETGEIWTHGKLYAGEEAIKKLKALSENVNTLYYSIEEDKNLSGLNDDIYDYFKIADPNSEVSQSSYYQQRCFYFPISALARFEISDLVASFRIVNAAGNGFKYAVNKPISEEYSWCYSYSSIITVEDTLNNYIEIEAGNNLYISFTDVLVKGKPFLLNLVEYLENLKTEIYSHLDNYVTKEELLGNELVSTPILSNYSKKSDLSLSEDYSPSGLTNEALNPEAGNTYEEAIGKLHKSILDNEQTVSEVINTVNSSLGFTEHGEYQPTSEELQGMSVTEAVDTIYSQSASIKDEIDSRIEGIIGTAPEALDTLGEIADKLSEDSDAIEAINGVLAGKLATIEDLEDIRSKANSALLEHLDISHLATKNELTTRVNAITGVVNSKASADDVSALSARVETLEGIDHSQYIVNTDSTTIKDLLNLAIPEITSGSGYLLIKMLLERALSSGLNLAKYEGNLGFLSSYQAGANDLRYEISYLIGGVLHKVVISQVNGIAHTQLNLSDLSNLRLEFDALLTVPMTVTYEDNTTLTYNLLSLDEED